MDSLYSRAISLAVPIFVSLVVLEFVIDSIRRTRYYHLADAVNNLSCGMVSTGMRIFFGFLGLFVYQWTLGWAPVHLASTAWPTWLLAFVFYDFCYYWQHRLGHTVGLFWASHSVHHQSEEFNLTTALRQPGTGAFTNWIFYLPMALCGIPMEVFLMVGVVQLFYQFWPHTRLIGRLGVLDRWIQTPSNHRVHHAQNDLYLDRNYVGVFPSSGTHLFGTFQEERDEEPCIYGVRGQLKSWNPVWANLHYYSLMLHDSWHARSWRDKLRVWWAPPGWRPADVAARFLAGSYDLRSDFLRFDPPRNLALSLYVLVQFGALLIAHSDFLARLNKQSTAWSALYFLFLLLSLVLLGGLLENRRLYVVLEALRLFAVAILSLSAGGPVAIVLFAFLSLAWLLAAGRTTALSQAPDPVSC